MKKLISKTDKIFKNFKVEDYELYFVINDADNFDTILKDDAKYIQKQLLEKDCQAICDKHNKIVDKMATMTNKRDFFKAMEEIDALWIELDVKLALANMIIKASNVA